ncbi:hypothetical protein [Streptomyces sp. NPDC086989]|uniref:hypothetical protein n=1 Tax=Streptomyces sp. NPDC086989 TaxID=3365764 RepID=UPI003808D7DE
MAADLKPTTCVGLLVRDSRYLLHACAEGGVGIVRYDQAPLTLAAQGFARPNTYIELSARIEGTKLSVTAYGNNNPGTISLSADDPTYRAGDRLAIVVYTVNAAPASARVSDFRYVPRS